MERSEAIHAIDIYKDVVIGEDDSVIYRALCMAIDELEQPEIIYCKDCRFRMEYYGKYCCWLDAEDKIVEDYDFCSRAERSKDGEQ